MADVAITVTAREKFVLTTHMLNNIMPKDTAEGIKYYDVFKELELAAARKLLTSKESNKVFVEDFDDSVMTEVPVSKYTVEYLIEILNKPMNGVQALTLVPLTMRLKAIQLDQYSK